MVATDSSQKPRRNVFVLCFDVRGVSPPLKRACWRKWTLTANDGREQETNYHNSRQHFLHHLEECYSHGAVHDCLEIGQGLTRANVVFWKMMEYLPFRRMNLHKGKWKAIRW